MPDKQNRPWVGDSGCERGQDKNIYAHTRELKVESDGGFSPEQQTTLPWHAGTSQSDGTTAIQL